MRDTLVCRDRTLITIDGSRLEIRGAGWGRRTRGQPPNADVFRECRLSDDAQARRVAVLLKQMLDTEAR